jgi:hypothetical protein
MRRRREISASCFPYCSENLRPIAENLRPTADSPPCPPSRPRVSRRRDTSSRTRRLADRPFRLYSQIGSSASFQSERSTASRVAQPARTLPRTAVHARAGGDSPPFIRAATITAASGSTTTKYRPCTPSI